MQSGYGVSEFQQFLVDGCSPILSMSHDISNSSHPQKHHQLHIQEQQHQHPHHHQQQQHRFYHPHHNSTTQQFFQQYPFQFQQQQQQRRLYQQLGLDQESGPENEKTSSRIIGAGGSLPFVVANLKLPDENSGSREALNEDDTILGVSCGGVEGGSDSRATIADHQRWQQNREEDPSIKEPFWVPLDTEYINSNNKRCKEKMVVSNKHGKKADDGNEHEECNNSGSNCGLFDELEAIYTHGSGSGCGNHQTGSGSALTGDNPLTTVAAPILVGDPRSGIDHGSETSAGEEASLKNVQENRRKKKRKQMSCIASFFESLVKQLMDHQETLHRKFVEVMEKKDEERTNREEAWRRQEMAKSNREAISRAHEHALASSREAAIVAILEKITGESIDLPSNSHFNFQTQFHEESLKEENANQHSDAFNGNYVGSENNNNSDNIINNNDNNNTRRWPKAEVHALIRVRSSLESRFLEPGLKGPLWEEVSSLMASMGYQRSTKRCKEKWENINKYFRKTKGSSKKRSQQSKTCPYFHQLDQLYSKSVNPSVSTIDGEPKDNLELLDSIVVPTDQNPSLAFVHGQLNIRPSFKFSDIGSQRFDFNGNGNDNVDDDSSAKAENREDNEDDEDDEDDDEGEGENQEHMQKQRV